MFALLADKGAPYFARVPWDKLHLFWVDERCVPPDNDESNYKMTNQAMLSKVPLPAAQIHRMEGELDPEVAASRYEAVLRAEFGLRAIPCSTWCCSAWATMATPRRCFRTPRR